MNGGFLKAGLVHEISLLLCAAVDGSTGSPAIFEADEDGLHNRLKLALVSATPGAGAGAGAGDMVHLRYRFSKR